MKPEYVSETDYERLMTEARLNVETAPGGSRLARVMPQIYEVVAAGLWLQSQAAGEGAAEQQAKYLAFAHGQACFPSREPWATAQALLQRWRDGRAPRPGAAFGDELLMGDVSDLPKGGLRIVRCQPESEPRTRPENRR